MGNNKTTVREKEQERVSNTLSRQALLVWNPPVAKNTTIIAGGRVVLRTPLAVSIWAFGGKMCFVIYPRRPEIAGYKKYWKWRTVFSSSMLELEFQPHYTIHALKMLYSGSVLRFTAGSQWCLQKRRTWITWELRVEEWLWMIWTPTFSSQPITVFYDRYGSDGINREQYSTSIYQFHIIS